MTQRLGGTICSAASWPMAFCGSAVTRASKSCFGSALNLKGEPPSDADIAAVLQQISRQVIRTLRYLGYLEAGSTDAVTTGYDPLRSEAPELARTLAASVTQRIAFGERAGQHVRRIGSGFGDEGERPALSGDRRNSPLFGVHTAQAVFFT